MTYCQKVMFVLEPSQYVTNCNQGHWKCWGDFVFHKCITDSGGENVLWIQYYDYRCIKD